MKNEELKIISDEIIIYLSLENNKDNIFCFLRDLLSEKEIIEFSKRFETAKMLTENISYKEIEQKTKMSSTTIARISKYLNWENNWYKNAISKIKSIYTRHHEGHQT